jgi:hypothetical protein
MHDPQKLHKKLRLGAKFFYRYPRSRYPLSDCAVISALSTISSQPTAAMPDTE